VVYRFPNTTNLPKGDDDTPIYSGSIGSNRIFYTLQQTAGSTRSPRWDLFLISIYTLVRNAYQKGINSTALEAMVDRDSDLYMTMIGAYCSYRRMTNATVLFYAPDYSAIPKHLLRVHTGHYAELDVLYQALYRKLPNKLVELTEESSTRKFLAKVGSGTFPHKQLPGIIRALYGGHRPYGAIGTVLLSHCPIDLHLYKTIPSLDLLESYTAAIIHTDEFGRKLTKEVKIPFNTTTHRLFGDDIHLMPLLKGREKSKLIDLAGKQFWEIRTEGEIIENVTQSFSTITQGELGFLRL